MAQIFQPRDNFLSKASVIGFLLSLALGFGLLTYLSFSPYPSFVQKHPDQPIQFPHNLHIGLRLDCRYCHSSVEKSSFASIPTTQTCMACHSQIATNNPQIQRITQSWESNTPIEWNLVHDLGDFAHFPHSIHVAKGVGCTTCHGQVNQMTTIQQKSPLTMGWCLDCHRNPEQHLRPQDQITSVTWQPPADQLEQGRRLIDEYQIDVQKLTNCSLCHY